MRIGMPVAYVGGLTKDGRRDRRRQRADLDVLSLTRAQAEKKRVLKVLCSYLISSR